jgi:hypothetical protein
MGRGDLRFEDFELCDLCALRAGELDSSVVESDSRRGLECLLGNRHDWPVTSSLVRLGCAVHTDTEYSVRSRELRDHQSGRKVGAYGPSFSSKIIAEHLFQFACDATGRQPKSPIFTE